MTTATAAQAGRQSGRPTLTRDRVVDAAVALAAERGLDAVTLRAVAARLGVTPMPLYRHVATRDDLVDAVVERLLDQDPDPQPWPASWPDLLLLVGRRTRRVLETHPAVFDAVRRRALTATVAMEGFEQLLAAGAAEGVPAEDAVDAYRSVLLHVVGYVALRTGRRQGLAAQGRTEAQERARVEEELRRLPAEDFPRLTRAAPAVADLLDEAAFERGLLRLVAAATPPATPDGPRGRRRPG